MSGWQLIDPEDLPVHEKSFLVTDGVYVAEVFQVDGQLVSTLCGCEFTNAAYWMPLMELPPQLPEPETYDCLMHGSGKGRDCPRCG